ncbi:expressed unknown protein [Seminavis robusta]|uniref:Uncharacterized protein n=1 Tax=Seminavis robusta TaxID=568900 RepID=A0A9N8EP02_9STRA|nr:expressed unknown protein [Seminavis robusta]|eukprot:Sro1312_g261860.1 n/a (128) ;mRNA; f:26916-27299
MMMGSTMLQVSLWLNSIIVFPLSYFLLVAKPKRMDMVMGPDTQARRILASIYLSIGIVSAKATTLPTEQAVQLAVPLFGMQIVYKSITAFSCLKWNQPIYANQFVTAVHLCTLYCLKQDGLTEVSLL